MPNHVHAILNPLGRYELEDLLRNMKGYVARQTNRLLGRTGTLWEEESYDRILRDSEHLWRDSTGSQNSRMVSSFPEPNGDVPGQAASNRFMPLR